MLAFNSPLLGQTRVANSDRRQGDNYVINTSLDSKLISSDIQIKDQKCFQLGNPFERKWYNLNDKTSKYRLGKLYHATIQANGSNEEKNCIVRVIAMPRNSAYVIENF